MAELNNARYEKFAQCLASGMSQRKAYLAAFPNAQRWKPETVDSKACNLAKDDKIRARLKELAELSTSKLVMNATQRKEWLTSVIQDSEEETKDRLKACDILNRMDGEYVDKVQMNAQVSNPMAGLTTEELKKLIGDG